MSRLRARVIAMPALSAAHRRGMFEIFEEYYEDVAFDRFERDLSHKDDVIVLFDASGRVQGFSTMKNLSVVVNGKRVTGLFSGDTVVARAFWGQRVLGRAFLRYLFAKRLKNPLTPYYWFLISKGYKTYLLMANNFADHQPCVERTMPAWDKAVLDAFGTALYPEEYDAKHGLITFAESQGHLRHGVAPITADLRAKHARIAFFETRNPTWEDGTELACIARMTWTMPLAYGMKAIFKKPSGGTAKAREPAMAATAFAREGGE